MRLVEGLVHHGDKEIKGVQREVSVSAEAVQRIKDYAEDAHVYYGHTNITYPQPGTPKFKSHFREQVRENAYKALDAYSFFEELAKQLERNGSATLTPERSKGLKPKTIDISLISEIFSNFYMGERRFSTILKLIYPGRDGYEKQEEIRGILSKGKTVRLLPPKE